MSEDSPRTVLGLLGLSSDSARNTWGRVKTSLYLSEFDVKLVHISGTKMVQSDALSRRPDFIPLEDTDNEDVVLLPETLFVNLIDTDLQERILNCEKLDMDAMEALKTLLEEGSQTIQNQLVNWTTEQINGKQVLYYRGKNYIPQNGELR